MREQNRNKKREEGITLVALAITIVILIILAGVSINVVMGDGGLIQQAKYAKELTTNSIEKEKEEMNTLMKELEGAIQGPTEQGVEITISKTPETEMSENVILKVESVKGIEGNIDLNTVKIESLSEEEKKNMLKTLMVYGYNSYNMYYHYLKSFQEYIEILFEGDEDYFWYDIYDSGGIDNNLQETINYLKEAGIQTINNYFVVNQYNEFSNELTVSQNGEYMFTVIEISTGKTYTKSVQVSNIDSSMQNYYIVGKPNYIELLDKSDKTTNFEEAYIIYNNKRIDVTECIEVVSEGIKYIDSHKMVLYLNRIGLVDNISSLNGTLQTIEIVKDSKSYSGKVEILWLA